MVTAAQASRHLGKRTSLRPVISVSLVFLLVLGGLCVPAPAQQPPPLRKTRLDMVFSSSLFRSVNRSDAIAAIRVWASMLGRNRGFEVEPTVDVVDDVEEMRRRIQAGSAGLLALDVVEYFRLADLAVVEPIFSATRGVEGTAPRYLVLVRAESGINSLEALRGKTAIVHASTAANLGRLWLDAMLHDRRFGPAESFLGTVQVVPKASAAVLPVFFGKADIAVVDQGSFDVMAEMNPQIGKKLRILRASPNLTEGIICVSPGQVGFREELLDSMRTLHLSIQGRQILTVFQFGRLAPVDRLALESVRELWRKHLLVARAPKQAPLRTLPRAAAPPATQRATQ